MSTPGRYARRAKASARSGDFSQAGDFHRLAGDWKLAIEMYLKGGHFDLAAHLAEEMGDLTEAARYYFKAGDLAAAGEIEQRLGNRDKAAWMFNRAGQHARAAELFEALGQLEAAAEARGKGGFHEQAGMLFARAGKHLPAAQVFERLIAEAGRDEPGGFRSESEKAAIFKYHRYCGELYMRAQQPLQAAPHLEEALLLDQAAEAWRLAGNAEKAADILLRIQRPEEAYNVLQAAGKDLSSLAPGIQAEILVRQGKHAEAAEVYERAGTLFLAAEAWKEAGYFLKAAQLFEKEGESEQAASNFIRAGKPAEAARILEAARDFLPAADLYRKAGRVEDAARLLLLAGDPVGAARIHYDRKEYEPCIKALQKVGAEHQEFRKASFLLGRIFAEQGLHTLAADKFLAAIGDADVNRENIVLFYSLALSHEANLRPREALKIYQRILAHQYGYKDVLDRIRAIESQPLNTLGARGGSKPVVSAGDTSEPGRYVVERSLGRSRLGEVFQGFDTVLGRPVALRRLEETPDEAGKADRFIKEAAAAARLSHPGIVATYDTGVDGQGKFVVCALAEGRPLRALLSEKMRFEVNRIVEIGRQILQALEHAHGQGVLHRNLRPENVFVGEEDRVGVADFGLGVRLSDFKAQDLSGGTQIQYTPPEVFLRDKVDARSDLYSVGVILYEMAMGHPPFQGRDVGHQHVNDAVPPPAPGERPLPEFLKATVLRALEKDKTRRYPDAHAMLEDLKLKEIVPGMVVGERYEVLAEVGRGGMGAIFRARDIEIDETVALKCLSGEIDAETVARFIQEIKAARRVVHPNVLRVYTLEKWRDQRFIVMEYIDGVSLPRYLQRSPVPALSDRMRIALQITSAVDAAHRAGIIHRDIKPENILVTPSGDSKILDFGIARPVAAEPGLTAKGLVMGTPTYMSPEQIQGEPLDRRTDVYSLGAVLYVMFTGVEPFAGNDLKEIFMKHLDGNVRPPHEIVPTLPRRLSAAIMKALEIDRERRFASAADLNAALASMLRSSAA
jgi:serine/threonine protein kinase